MKKRSIILSILAIQVLAVFTVRAQSYVARGAPARIILNLTESPQSSMAVTWRTVEEFPNSEVQYAVATPWTEFKKALTKTATQSERFEVANHQFVFHYSAVLKGLEPGVMYVYRVGHDSVWSEWNQFTTARKEPEPFKFVYLGDPQNEIREHVSRVFREAYKIAPDAAFWLIAGDLVAYPYDSLWSEFFSAAGFITRTTPSIMIPGNHDQSVVIVDGKEKRLKKTDPIWNAHFTLPQNGLVGLEETSYYVDYQGVRFVMLNSNDKLREQAEWMERILASNQNKWTIVSFHHSVYPMVRDRDNKELRDLFQPIFDKYHVDLVLQGHDHAYARSFKLNNGSIVAENEPGTVYVISVSGPKAYAITTKFEKLMAKIGNQISLFQVLSVDGNKLSFVSYTASGEVYDAFELRK
jgi:hypothetical protein